MEQENFTSYPGHKFKYLAILVACLIFTTVGAVDLYPFRNHERQQLFKEMSEEMRCTVCANQSLTDSIAPTAQDIRRRLYQLTVDGHNKQEIIDLMVLSYGEEIHYKPKLHPGTILLWILPLLMVGIGFFIIRRAVRC